MKPVKRVSDDTLNLTHLFAYQGTENCGFSESELIFLLVGLFTACCLIYNDECAFMTNVEPEALKVIQNDV